MSECDFCGKKVDTPFDCNYCEGSFCGKHKLPPNHNCAGLEEWEKYSGPGVQSHQKMVSYKHSEQPAEIDVDSDNLTSLEKGSEDGHGRGRSEGDSSSHSFWKIGVRFERKFLKLLKYLGGILFVVGCWVTWISYFGLENIRSWLPSQIFEAVSYLVPSQVLSPVSNWLIGFFSNPVSAWGNGAWLSVFGFVLFFVAWLVSKGRSKYGRRYRDRTAFGIATKMGTFFALSIVLWLFSLMVMRTGPASAILEQSWPRTWFLGFLITLVSMGLYMGRIRRGSWWSKKKIFAIILAAIILISFGYYRTHPYFEFNSLSVDSEKVKVGDEFQVSVELLNTGGAGGTKNVKLFVDGAVEENRKVRVKSGQSRTITFSVSREEEGEYSLEVGGLSTSVEVVNPANNPIEYPEYYYGVAEDYVQKNFDVPQEKNIEGLATFLNEVKLPTYVEGEFDCSDSSAVVEWLLEGTGFDVKIASNSRLGEMVVNSHTWVMVSLSDGRKVAVEATYLAEGSNYYPPAIVEAPNGDFEYYSYESYYDRRHPNKYLTGSVWDLDYYNPVVTYDSPKPLVEGKMIGNTRYYMKESEFDWWNESYFKNQEPFSDWD